MTHLDLLRGATVGALRERWPYAERFLGERGLELPEAPAAALADCCDAALLADLAAFLTEMEAFLSGEEETVGAITVLGGRDKRGAPEPVRELTVDKGDVVCIVGPTGSGKSRLLADIEWVARGDTPTGRRVLVDGREGDERWRAGGDRKLVAQLSQNMNFVIDMGVGDFLALHAESRRADDIPGKVSRIWAEANALAGEPFALDTPVTSLSGGQSRALMIADTAVLSHSPVVLIDEIENAGIDRRKALEVLVGQDKIVLMATHDPILALMGDRRVVVGNGAMRDVIEPSAAERANLVELRALDARLMELRGRLRRGERLDVI
ncbi:MAG: ATP-binding cassette domain-containing protein [bacterium]|nr:ATP-binding cassette domain-containing protein [bacterium]